MKFLGYLFFLPLIGVINAQDYCPSEATGCQDCSTRWDYNNITSSFYTKSNGKCTVVFSWPFEYQPDDSNPWLQFGCEYIKTGEKCNSGYDTTCASCLTYTITDLDLLYDPYIIYYDSCDNFFDIPLVEYCVNAIISTKEEETTSTITTTITTTTHSSNKTSAPPTFTSQKPETSYFSTNDVTTVATNPPTPILTSIETSRLPITITTSHYPTTTERGKTTKPSKSTTQDGKTTTSASNKTSSSSPVVTTHQQSTSDFSYCPDYQECQECPINYKIPIFTQHAELYGNSECTVTFTWEYHYQRNIRYEFSCQYTDGSDCITDGPYVCGSCENYTIHNIKNFEDPLLEYRDYCEKQWIPIILTRDCFWSL